MEGSMIYIYIQIYHVTNDMTRLYHITYNQYETNMTLLTKRTYLFHIENCQDKKKKPTNFFSEHRPICSNILFHLANMIYTKKETYYRG